MIQVSDDYIYLDWAATAPLCEEAAQAMAPYMTADAKNLACNMNANSLHSPGRAAFERMESARKSIAKNLGARRPSEIVFTSGATEANNMALFGLLHVLNPTKQQAAKRFITSAIEHDAILKPAKTLEHLGYEVVYLKPDKSGFIQAEDLQDALKTPTALVSIQLANSEIGAIQNIAQLSSLAHAYGALFHTDATQALGKMPLDVSALDVDAASFSAHKIGGPKGIGALYLRANTPFTPLLQGGGQEAAKRSTTQNVCGIVGFEAALCARLKDEAKENERQRQMRDNLYARLSDVATLTPSVLVPSQSSDYLPNIVNVFSSKLESQTLLLRLDAQGFGVSGGSACSSSSLEPSHVLNALGISSDDAQGELRISFGPTTTQADLDQFIEALTESLD